MNKTDTILSIITKYMINATEDIEKAKTDIGIIQAITKLQILQDLSNEILEYLDGLQ